MHYGSSTSALISVVHNWLEDGDKHNMLGIISGFITPAHNRFNPLNVDCVYIRACALLSQRRLHINTQAWNVSLVRMSIMTEEAPDNFRRQLHPYLAAAATNASTVVQ